MWNKTTNNDTCFDEGETYKLMLIVVADNQNLNKTLPTERKHKPSVTT
jgi:hypothetical protein